MKTIAIVCAALIGHGAVCAQPDANLAALSVAQLRSLYLACDRASARVPLDLATGAYCAMAHDELRERGFGGSWEKLLAWWRSAREAETAAAARE